MNKTVLWVLLIVIVVLGGWYMLAQRDSEDAPQDEAGTNSDTDTVLEEESQDDDNDPDEEANAVTVTYSSSGFTPGEVRISRGGTVIFRDSGTGNMWVASAMHPTHTSYPGSDIDLCGTAQQVGIFDQCGASAEFRFVFNETGTWGYHNHMQASHFGRIVVE